MELIEICVFFFFVKREGEKTFPSFNCPEEMWKFFFILYFSKKGKKNVYRFASDLCDLSFVDFLTANKMCT